MGWPNTAKKARAILYRAIEQLFGFTCVALLYGYINMKQVVKALLTLTL
jgi:hypothetical protein